MCGIVGMAGDIESADRATFRDMLDVCQLRGRDSTGVVSVNRQMSYGYYKNVGPPAFMFDRKSYAETIEQGTHAVLLGHCRHKTSGAVTRDNAHPFDFEDEGIIGVHNGTLRNYARLDGYKHDKVDSEVLFNHLALNGPEETFNQIEGAWACVWWNDVEETLNFIRNKERTLYFTWSEDRRKMFWASEDWMFGAVERKTPLWKGPKDDWKDRYILLPENTLWSFSLSPNSKKGEPTVTMAPGKVIEPKAPQVLVRQGHSSWGTGGNGSQTHYGAGSNSHEPPWEIWNKKTDLTHEWNKDTRTHKPRMSYQEWEKKYAEILEEKKKGGSVPNPFLKKLDDELPADLQPKQKSLVLIPGGKTNTQSSTSNSMTILPSSTESEKGSKSTTTGKKDTTSQGPENSTNSQRTVRKDFSGRLRNLQQGNGGLSPSKVSFRVVAGMPFITDETNGVEYSEQQVEENTGGVCSFCDDPIGDLTEISQFFGKEKFICTHCTEPSVRSSVA